MLASITPLGERGRGFSWNVTATAFAVGAVGAGAVAGARRSARSGRCSRAAPSGGRWRWSAVLSVAVLFDATPLRSRLPTTRRQVNEDWVHRYRGWVYGISFGAQLGVGLATHRVVSRRLRDGRERAAVRQPARRCGDRGQLRHDQGALVAVRSERSRPQSAVRAPLAAHAARAARAARRRGR